MLEVRNRVSLQIFVPNQPFFIETRNMRVSVGGGGFILVICLCQRLLVKPAPTPWKIYHLDASGIDIILHP
ncbi:MAG TPA: hypothetical protein DCY88_20460 [Cyanobacteria bacterium UBA11372]|nr:hypothetical protein [Cyanobacteria bacterium UBA11372]